ncbi:MAG: zf-HC2 domain-containing protein [Planctomycetota bacterium]|jgi:hypothetical protein
MAQDLSCSKTQKLLALLPGSDLPPELDQPVRDHLAGCRACQRQLGDHLRVRSALGRLAVPAGHPAAGATFFAAMKGEILRRVTGDEVRRQTRLARASSQRLTLARWMTAAAMLLLAVYLIPQLLPNTPDLPTASPAPAPVSSVRDAGFRSGALSGYLPPVGLHGQEEVLRNVLVLDGKVFRLVGPLTSTALTPTAKPDPTAGPQPRTKANRSR